MPMDNSDAMARLMRDFKFFLSGETPSQLDFASAPLLEGWRAVVVHPKFEQQPLLPILLLIGRVLAHPHHLDGRMIHTSQLIWLAYDRTWARTWNRVYRLGKRADD